MSPGAGDLSSLQDVRLDDHTFAEKQGQVKPSHSELRDWSQSMRDAPVATMCSPATAPTSVDSDFTRAVSASPAPVSDHPDLAVDMKRRSTTIGSTGMTPMSRNNSHKRLNWAEMICYTISESPTGKLVIRDLFEGMCHKYPDVAEWATGKDWEARVKNRIKSTLSIKGNLFVKVPRPSRAGGKGSWWTLSPEAKEAIRQGRISEAIRGTGPYAPASGGSPTFDGPNHDVFTPTRLQRGNRRASSDKHLPPSHHGRSRSTSEQNSTAKLSMRSPNWPLAISSADFRPASGRSMSTSFSDNRYGAETKVRCSPLNLTGTSLNESFENKEGTSAAPNTAPLSTAASASGWNQMYDMYPTLPSTMLTMSPLTTSFSPRTTNSTVPPNTDVYPSPFYNGPISIPQTPLDIQYATSSCMNAMQTTTTASQFPANDSAFFNSESMYNEPPHFSMMRPHDVQQTPTMLNNVTGSQDTRCMMELPEANVPLHLQALCSSLPKSMGEDGSSLVLPGSQATNTSDIASKSMPFTYAPGVLGLDNTAFPSLASMNDSLLSNGLGSNASDKNVGMDCPTTAASQNTQPSYWEY